MVAATGAEQVSDSDRAGPGGAAVDRSGVLEGGASDAPLWVEDVARADMKVGPEAVAPTRELRVRAPASEVDEQVAVIGEALRSALAKRSAWLVACSVVEASADSVAAIGK